MLLAFYRCYNNDDCKIIQEEVSSGENQYVLLKSGVESDNGTFKKYWKKN